MRRPRTTLPKPETRRPDAATGRAQAGPQHASSRGWRRRVGGALGSCVLVGSAWMVAAPARGEEPLRAVPHRIEREVLMELGRQRHADIGWLEGGEFRIKLSGLQWKKKMVVDDRRMVLKLGGPVTKRGYGLRLELEF